MKKKTQSTYEKFTGNKKQKRILDREYKELLKSELLLAASIPWEELAKDRIAKYKKSGLALRGARYREGLSQKELSKRTGISQENISKMENGQRVVGEKVAEKLAKVLCVDFELLTDFN